MSKSPNSPVLQIMLRKFAHDYAADGVVADAMRDAAAEIDRLNEWADGMTDTVLRERKAADALIKELQAKLAARPEERTIWNEGFRAGFGISGEGWNDEYPFSDKNEEPEKSDSWLNQREHAWLTRLGMNIGPEKHG